MLCYYSGKMMGLDDIKLPVLDPEFIFGDGVYEVIAAYHKHMFGGDGHICRLLRSLNEIGIKTLHDASGWKTVLKSVIDSDAWEDQSIYIQVTRGLARRDHPFPKDVSPTIFIISSELVLPSQSHVRMGVSAVTAQDTRRAGCGIKRMSSLPTVLLRQNSVVHRAYETVLIREGMLTEGPGGNIFAVTNGTIVKPPDNSTILGDVTRDIVVILHAIWISRLKNMTYLLANCYPPAKYGCPRYQNRFCLLLHWTAGSSAIRQTSANLGPYSTRCGKPFKIRNRGAAGRKGERAARSCIAPSLELKQPTCLPSPPARTSRSPC